MGEIVSGDAETFLLPWYDIIAQNGLYEQVGDYNLLYQFMIWLMTKIPISPLACYKILSCIFDYMIAIIAALLVIEIDKEKGPWNGIVACAAVLLCPVTFLNSAAWAQCDAIFTAFAILGIYYLEKSKYNLALISLGISFAFKIQAVFILPVYLFVYFVRRKFSVLQFVLVPLSMVATGIPVLFWGRSPLETFSIYFKQTTSYQAMSMNYPSFWNLLCQSGNPDQYNTLKMASIAFVVCLLAAIMIFWIQKKYTTQGKNLIIMAFILAYTCVLFLPSMHERYSYLYEMCAIILMVLIPKTIPLCIGLLLIAMHTYGTYLFWIPVNFVHLSFFNIALYVAYFYFLTVEMEKNMLGSTCEGQTHE